MHPHKDEEHPNSRKSITEIKKRAAYAAAVVITIILGLSCRKFAPHLPELASRNGGDALWAIMVYFGFRMLLIRKGVPLAAMSALLFSFGVEFSQLLDTGWIEGIRGTALGALVLGKGWFLLADLVRYTVGILMACAADLTVQRWSRSKLK